jgi:hypothetical protein
MIKYGNASVLWNRIYTIGANPTKTDKEIIEFKVLFKKLMPEAVEGFEKIDKINKTNDKEN